MNIEDLIESTKYKKATLESIQAFEERLRKREEKFAKETMSEKTTSEFLARSYNI